MPSDTPFERFLRYWSPIVIADRPRRIENALEIWITLLFSTVEVWRWLAGRLTCNPAFRNSSGTSDRGRGISMRSRFHPTLRSLTCPLLKEWVHPAKALCARNTSVGVRL